MALTKSFNHGSLKVLRSPLPDHLDAVIELRQLALEGLLRVLGADAQAALTIDPTALSAWLIEPEIGGAVQERAARQISVAFLTHDPAIDDLVTRDLLAASLPAGLWPRLIDQWRQRGKQVRRLSPGLGEFVPSLCAEAFLSPQFRLRNLRAIRQHLETRVIFYPDGPPVATLSLQTCLLLAAFAAEAPASVRPGLKRAARAGIKVDGWAGFWDQWVIAQFSDRRSAQYPDELRSLPLVAFGANALSGDHQSADPRCAPRWAQSAPKWAPFLLLGTP